MKPVIIGSASGGAGSYFATHRAAERYGYENTTVLFADVLGEDGDTYASVYGLCAEVVAEGGQAVRLTDGRNIWQVFRDERFVGNSRVDPCSKILKRQLIRWWLDSNYGDRPELVRVVIGYDWTEGPRIERLRPRYAPYEPIFPLTDEPLIEKPALVAMLKERGYKSFLYDTPGFSHSNCAGFCVKMGQAQARVLLRVRPEVYRWHEEEEERTRALLGDVAVLRYRSGPKKGQPYPLREFRENVESQGSLLVDAEDYGEACSCMEPASNEPSEAPRSEPTVEHWCAGCNWWAKPNHLHVSAA